MELLIPLLMIILPIGFYIWFNSSINKINFDKKDQGIKKWVIWQSLLGKLENLTGWVKSGLIGIPVGGALNLLNGATSEIRFTFWFIMLIVLVLPFIGGVIGGTIGSAINKIKNKPSKIYPESSEQFSSSPLWAMAGGTVLSVIWIAWITIISLLN